MEQEQPPKQKWLKLYSIVLIANALYFIAFYMITKSF